MVDSPLRKMSYFEKSMTSFRRIVTISKIITETSLCRTFLLQSQNDQKIPYRAGQYLTFVFGQRDEEQRRNYSLSSSPVLNEPMAITVKRIPNGQYSRILVDRMKPGDQLMTIGANGFFTLPDDQAGIDQIFFLAAGSGITPVFSLIKTAMHTWPHTTATLIYSNSSPQDTIFESALIELQRKYPGRFQIEWLFSNAGDYTRARLSNWLLTELLDKYRKASLEKTLFYLCGPIDYMRMITITLLASGVNASRIRKEEFVISPPPIVVVPPDKELRQIGATINGQYHQFTTAFPRSILASAKQAGIEIPYSCESGRCGACAAMCIQGTVWMSYNEVLTGEDIQQNKVLTCTGYPVFGNVELDFDAIRRSATDGG